VLVFHTPSESSDNAVLFLEDLSRVRRHRIKSLDRHCLSIGPKANVWFLVDCITSAVGAPGPVARF